MSGVLWPEVTSINDQEAEHAEVNQSPANMQGTCATPHMAINTSPIYMNILQVAQEATPHQQQSTPNSSTYDLHNEQQSTPNSNAYDLNNEQQYTLSNRAHGAHAGQYAQECKGYALEMMQHACTEPTPHRRINTPQATPTQGLTSVLDMTQHASSMEAQDPQEEKGERHEWTLGLD